jgi:hypothetical protein
MQHEDEKLLGNYDRGEFEVFLRQNERELSAPQPADLSVVDDSVWKRFVTEVECESAARELGLEVQVPTHERLRSERGEREAGAEFWKSAEGRRRTVLRKFMDDFQERGESSEETQLAMRVLLLRR